MHDAPVVDVVDSTDQLLQHPGHVALLALQLGQQFSALHVLHEQEDVVLVAEVAVELDDVGVVEHVEDLQLQAELLLHVVLLYRRLEDLLQREEEARCLVSATVHLPELARADLSAHLELPQ